MNMVKKFSFYCLMSVLIFSCYHQAFGESMDKKLKFGVGLDFPNTYDRLLSEALKKIGCTLSVSSQGTTSAAESANNGELDGMYTQPAGLEQLYKNLIRIPVALDHMNINIYTREDYPKEIQSWSDLKGQKVGFLYQKTYIEDHVPKDVKKIVHAATNIELFQALTDGNIDFALISNNPNQNTYSTKNTKFYSTIESMPTYYYMNTNNKDIAQKLTAVLQKMKDNGEADAILNMHTSTSTSTNNNSSRKNFLYITSLNDESKWVSAFKQGLTTAIPDNTNEMDTLSLNFHYTPSDFIRIQAINTMLRNQILDKKPDAIIASDTAALDYIKLQHYAIFNGIPVIYGGADNTSSSDITGQEDYLLGYPENLSIHETVEEALKLFPKTKNIFVINDHTQFGEATRKEVEHQLKDIALPIQYNENSDMKTLLDTIKNLPKDTIILSGKYFYDSNGEYFLENESQSLFSENSVVPIFGLMSTSLGYGQIGGKYFDAVIQGKTVGKLAYDYTTNKTFTMPTDLNSLNKWKFDFRVLQKYGIKKNLLPQNVEIINEPLSIIQRRPLEFFISIFILLFGIVALFLITNFWRILKIKNNKLTETLRSLHTAEELLNKDNMIEEAKIRFEKTLDGSPIGFMVSEGGLFKSINQYAGDLLGFENGLEDRIFFDNLNDKSTFFDTLHKERTVFGEILKLKVQDGEPHRLYTNVSQFQKGDNDELHIWFYDIESNEKRKDMLANIQNDLQTIIDLMQIPVIVLDVHTRQQKYINAEFYQFFEFPKDMPKEKMNTYDISPKYQPNGVLSTVLMPEKIQESLDSDVSISWEWQYVLKSGRIIDAELRSSKLTYHGETSLTIVAKDVGAEKKQAQTLQAIAEEEKQANLLKSRFLIGMSHEIRTPMNAIVGLSEIELHKRTSNENTKSFEKIKASSKNLLTIIDDILDFSKIETEELVIIEEEVDLEEVVSNALLMATQRVGEKPIEIILNMVTSVPKRVLSDSTRLWQILKNLLDNSAKYTLKGKIKLTIDVLNERDNNTMQTLRFVIEDTGLGMNKEQLSRLFTPFEQFHTRSTQGITGTGLGMSITKQLTQLMKGTIVIESTEGVGTTTIVDIPFKIPNSSKPIKEMFENISFSKYKILLVDDDIISLNIMENLLFSIGAKPVCASSGSEALAQIKENYEKGSPFEIIIIDYLLGDTDGLQLTKQLKSYLDTTITRLLMVSAYTKQLLSQQIKDAGYSEVIEKPFCPSEFLRKISDAVEIPVSIASHENITFDGAKVLIVEDNLINQEVAQGILNLFGIQSTIANHGQEAIDLLETDTFDLILMDILMPVMDGHKATQLIRNSTKPYKNIPIVAMTANVMNDEVEKCFEEGMNAHIGKPVQLERLHATLSQYLEKYIKTPADFETSPIDSFPLTMSPIDRLKSINGLHVTEGLARFLNKTDSYIKNLKRFTEELTKLYIPLEDSFLPENIKDIEANVHTLKGMAGNLGIVAVYTHALAFEKNKSKEQYEALWDTCFHISEQILEVVE